MRDGVGKRFELAIRRFQLPRALGDALFEIGVHARTSLLRFDERGQRVAAAALVATQQHVQQDRGADHEQPALRGLQAAGCRPASRCSHTSSRSVKKIQTAPKAR